MWMDAHEGGGRGGGGGSMRDLGKSTDHLFLIGDNDRLKYLKVL